jgi:hypothetical protein
VALPQPSYEERDSGGYNTHQKRKGGFFEIVPRAPNLAHLMHSINDVIGRFEIINFGVLFPHSCSLMLSGKLRKGGHCGEHQDNA